MANFGFMRSGLVDVPMNVPEDFTNRLMSITLTMVTRAAVDAATYCEHAGRSNVTEADIAASLKRQAMHFATDASLEEDVAETQRILFDEEDEGTESEGTDSEGSEGTDSEYESMDESEGTDEGTESEGTDSEPEPWTRSTCTCDVCRTVNEALDAWDDWTPEDPVEQYLKRTVERSIEAANARLNDASDDA
jgi:histone H3/H4